MIQVGYVATEKYTYKEDSTLLEFIKRDDVLVDYYLIGTAYQPYGSTPCQVDEASDHVYESFWNLYGQGYQDEYVFHTFYVRTSICRRYLVMNPKRLIKYTYQIVQQMIEDFYNHFPQK